MFAIPIAMMARTTSTATALNSRPVCRRYASGNANAMLETLRREDSHKKAQKAQNELIDFFLRLRCLFVAKIRQQMVVFATSKSSLSLIDR